MKKSRSENKTRLKTPAKKNPPAAAPKKPTRDPGKGTSGKNKSKSKPAGDAGDEAEVTRPASKPFPIVGIGASAGGFEAAHQLTAHLPKNAGMAFVIVQHLDPSHESHLSDLLSQSATLPVTEIKNRMEVEPNRVYVMPPNVTVTIQKGRLWLSKRKTREIPPMPVDRFFRSLAEDQQNAAIGIVLSGTGSDGTLGLQAIKGAGGVTIAQDESSSKYFGMPGSAIAAEAVDFVLPPERIAEQLLRIASHPYIAESKEPGARPGRSAARSAKSDLEMESLLPESGNEFDRLFTLLRSRTGVDFSLYKHTTLRRRIMRRMVLHKLETLPAYLRFLENNPPEVDDLFNDLLINVTEFFRDPQTFQMLQRRIFPKMARTRGADSPLRIWVCGCSTGEEAYSLAMALVEFFEKTRTHRPVQIFATDISDAGIEKARAGIYPESISQDVSPERLRRFFTKGDGVYQVHKPIRDMCVFARQNVAMDPPFSNLDMISCRNVLIYLSPTLQRKVIPIFQYALRPNGYLLLGSSETIGSAGDLFTLVNKKHKIYQKKASAHRPVFDLASGGVGESQGWRPPASPGEAVPEPHTPDLHDHVDKLLLRDFAPAAVVINEQMDVLHFRGRTGDYLEHAPGAASLNLLKMVRESLIIDLRSVVTRAIRQDQPVRQTGVQLRRNGQMREVTIETVPFRLKGSSERFLLVLFKDEAAADTAEAGREGPGGKRRKSQRENRLTERLRHELNATKESLQSIIEEQETTNEELKSANEEIQSSNEELQSTNEELETAKEELQSTNEELTTLNEELQNRNNELSALNNDLTNLLSSVNIPILMLGNDLTIRRFTPMAERVFNLIPSDVGRRLSDMNRSTLVPNLEQSIKDVIDNLSTIEREVQDREGRWFSLRIRPYRTRENKIDGAVLLLLDVDELKRALDTLLATVNQPLLMLSADLKVKRANECFCKTFGLKAAEVENRLIYEVSDGQWNLPKLQTLLEAILPDNQQVNNFEMEADFRNIGHRRIVINARRFSEESRGIQLILLAMQVVDGSSR